MYDAWRSCINTLPSGKILDWSKFKAFKEDDKINVTHGLKLVLERTENIVGKGENVGYQHFLLFLQCFQKFFFFHTIVKSRDCVLRS